MNNIWSLFAFELKRRLKWKEIGIVVAVFLIFIFFIDQGKNKYTTANENSKIFQETEDRLVKSYINYTQYCSFGIRLLFIPSPFSILHNNPIYDGLLSTVNTGKKLSLDRTLKGKEFFIKKSPFNDFMGLVLLCAAGFGVLYGFYTPRKKAYLRFLSGFIRKTGEGKHSTGKMFFALAISRILLAALVFLLLLAISLLWLGIHHINLLQTPIIFFILLILITIIFFYFVGFLLGSLKNRTARAIGLVGFYVLSFILLPVLFNIHTDADVSEMESLFQFELKNMELVMGVEKRLFEKFGKSKDWEIASPELKEKIKEALNKEFQELFAREERLKEKILEKVRNRHLASCLYPVLFYNTAVGELSGCGELSVIEFYSTSLQRKKEFLAFYVEKKFMEQSSPGQVENFVKGNENLFYAKSRLPYRFWLGIAVSLLYIGILVMASYFRFKRVLQPVPGKGITSTETIDIELGRGEDYHIDTYDYAAVDHFYWVFSGNVKNFSGKISIDGKNILTGEKQDFVYICSIDDIPGEVKVNDLLRLIKRLSKLSKEQMDELKAGLGIGIGNKRFSDLQPDDQLKLLFKVSCLKGSAIYMFHDFVARCSPGYLQEFAAEISRLKSENALILYFKDAPLWKPMAVDHHNVYTRVADHYEWYEARDESATILNSK